MDARPFNPVDIRLMEVQPAQRASVALLAPKQVALMAQFPSETLWVGERPLACGGVVELWEGRGMAWSYLSSSIGSHFTAIHRQAKRFLYQQPYRRIEITVECEFEQGHRWARMLGFELEAPRMRAFSPAGEDNALYALVR